MRERYGGRFTTMGQSISSHNSNINNNNSPRSMAVDESTMVDGSPVTTTTAASSPMRPTNTASSSSTTPTRPTSIMRKSGSGNTLLVDDADVAAGLLRSSSKPLHARQSSSTSASSSYGQPPPKSSDSMVNFAASPMPAATTTNAASEHLDRSNNTLKRRAHNDAHQPSIHNSQYHVLTAPSSSQSLASLNTRPEHHPSDSEFFEDLVSEPVLLLGVDISHMTRRSQFLLCAAGVFGFSLLYGFLQELISVELCNRQLGLFLAMTQFSGYTLLAYVLRNFVYAKSVRKQKADFAASGVYAPLPSTSVSPVPFALYVGLSLLRAIDLGMTNLAMQYINYPAKTLMKSSRVVFTMLFGVVIARKVYNTVDYVIVLGMVAGLALFMHADATSSAVFDWAGVAMLTVSLLCDGAISNMSETIMNRYGVGQDEFIFRMYSIALVAITVVAAAKGDLREGINFMMQPGSYGPEMALPVEQRTWSVPGKFAIMILFSSMGFFGSSCSAAITKNFGALTMSMTSTARKATTLFLSFFLFHNVCTLEHLMGVFVFIAALTAKSLRRGKHSKGRRKGPKRGVDSLPTLSSSSPLRAFQNARGTDLEVRALHHGSLNSNGNMSSQGSTQLDLEEGSKLSTAGTVGTVSPPPSLDDVNLDSTVVLSTSSNSRNHMGQQRQRKATSASASPPIQVL